MEPSQRTQTHPNLHHIPVDPLQNTLAMSTTQIAMYFMLRELKHYFYKKLVTTWMPCLEKKISYRLQNFSSWKKQKQ